MWIKLLLISIICFTTVKQCESKFSIPQPSVDVTNGFKISITDRPGLELFVFHGKLNEDFNGHEEGEFSGEAKRTSSGVWSYENPMIELGMGDKVYYWIYVQANGLGYRLDNQVYEFDNKRKDPKPIEQPTKNKTNDVFVTPQPEVCQTTITTVKGKASCKSQLIFSDDFNTLQTSKWKEIVKIPSDKEDAEFVVYMKGIARIANGKLEIKPKLLTDLPEYSEDMFRTGNINLASQCTPDYDEQIECRRDVTNSPFQILPPIVSGRINTKNSFSFKYGKIEIRAKLPKGDWIYPELLLEPKDRYYGNGYDSGKIRIAFARGNINLVTPSTNDLSGKVLYSGAITDRFDTHRFDSASKVESQNHLGDDFHTYSLTWTNNLIIAQVDGVPYGSVFGRFKSTNKTVESAWNQGTVLAPFDQEFYITLAVGVGGLSDFPDKCESRPNLETYTKPWDNTSPKAELFFWRNKEKWLPSWNEDSKLIVDYVRVWAI